MLAKIKYPPFLAILAAALYALSTPFSKLLLGHVSATMLAALLYLGAGAGLLAARIVCPGLCAQKDAWPLSKDVLPYTVAMVLLDIAAPVLLICRQAPSARFLAAFAVMAFGGWLASTDAQPACV